MTQGACWPAPFTGTADQSLKCKTHRLKECREVTDTQNRPNSGGGTPQSHPPATSRTPEARVAFHSQLASTIVLGKERALQKGALSKFHHYSINDMINTVGTISDMPLAPTERPRHRSHG